MKKTLFMLIFVSISSLNHVVFCAPSTYQTWRGSVTSINETGVNLATGVIVIDKIMVLSTGSINASFDLFDTSVGTTGATPLQSFTGFDTTQMTKDWSFQQKFSSGCYYNNNAGTGRAAKVQINYRVESMQPY